MSNSTKFLSRLIEDLGLKKEYSKSVLAAMVYNTLAANKCGLSDDTDDAVRDALCEGVCDRYQFDVAVLAGDAWDNDLLDILCREEPQVDKEVFYEDFVWPYLSKNEILPGIRMY